MGPGQRPSSPGGTLYVVGTPIGNLGDVSARAIETLGAVPLIAAEDTRVSRRLTARHGLATPLVSFHARNARRRLPELLAHLRSGMDLALVTDAGTPGVSDPGAELVTAWVDEGGRVVPIPGPSAVTAAVSATGIAGSRWVFEGFLPRSGRLRRDRLAALALDLRGAVLFESAERLSVTLDDLVAACGGDRAAAICRELTKVHEQIVSGRLADLARRVASGEIPARGEIVIVLAAVREPAIPATPIDDEAGARAEVERLVAAGLARGEAARRVSRTSGIPRRRLYGH